MYKEVERTFLVKFNMQVRPNCWVTGNGARLTRTCLSSSEDRAREGWRLLLALPALRDSAIGLFIPPQSFQLCRFWHGAPAPLSDEALASGFFTSHRGMSFHRLEKLSENLVRLLMCWHLWLRVVFLFCFVLLLLVYRGSIQVCLPLSSVGSWPLRCP